MSNATIPTLNGAKILVQESDGLCHVSTLATWYDEATTDGEPRTILGWSKFDGSRQFYRLPDAAWSFAYLPETEARLIAEPTHADA